MPRRKKKRAKEDRPFIIRRLFEAAFNIRPNEFGLVQLFFLHFTTIGVFYTIGATAADTMFLSRFSPDKVKALLPWVYIGTAATSTLLTWFYDFVQGRVSRLKLLMGTHIFLGVSVVLFRYLIIRYEQFTWLYFLLVIWLESCSLISIMLSYSYAGDYFTTRDARRLYGYINGGLAFGTLVSGYMISPLVKWMGTDNLLFVIGGLQILSALWAVTISASTRPSTREEDELGEQRKAPLATIFGRPYVLLIMIVVVSGLICFRLTEFQFQITASRVMQEERLAIFFGKFYGYVGIAQVIIQFLLVGWLLGRFGVMKSLAVLPICLLGASAGFYFHPAVLTAALLNFARLAFSETLDLPSREVLFLPLPRRIRLRAQALFSGAIVPFGSGIGGAVILILVRHLEDIHHFAPITAGVVVLWLVCLLILRSFYKGTLAQTIMSGEVSPSDLQRLVSIPASGAVLNGLLRSQKDERVLFALDLLKLRKLGFLIDGVYRLTDSNNEIIARTAFELLGEEGARVPIEHFNRGIEDPRPPVRTAALLAYARIWREEAVPKLRGALNDSAASCRLAAMVGLIQFGGFDGAILAYPRLNDMLASARVADRVAAVSVLHRIGGKGYEQTIESLLSDRAREVRREAALVCADLRSPELSPVLVKRIGDPSLRQAVIRALESMPPEAGPLLAGSLKDRSLSTEDRSSLAIALAKVGQAEVLGVLFDLVASDEPIVLRSAAGRALRIARERGVVPDIDTRVVYGYVEKLIDRLMLVSKARIGSYKTDPGSSVLFLDRCLVILDIIFSLLILLTDKEELKGIEASLLSPDQTLRDNAVELLDVILPRSLSSRLIPVISNALHELPSASRGLSDELKQELLDSDDWLRCITLYHLSGGKRHKMGAKDMSKSDVKLLTIINTISFLKTVELFKDIPAEYLTGLAEIVREVSFFKGETLFKEGERGDSFYLIQEGQICVKKGRREVTRLERGECIGEMALLDGKPRSATCIVEKDAKLLRISSDNFSNLLSSHPEMAKALLRTLAQRLRKVTDRV
jgi:ATP/ADP translocase/HEAT repeat protein